ncbi:MAG TPA: hypothetical protein VEU33_01535 [Archangium sp.]|nr:hypothetical protein [Archangium sp.]
MNRTTPYRRLLTAALCFTLLLATVACHSAVQEEFVVGEASAVLSTSEESGDIGADAVTEAHRAREAPRGPHRRRPRPPAGPARPHKDGRLSPEEALPLRQEIKRCIIKGQGAH